MKVETRHFFRLASPRSSPPPCGDGDRVTLRRYLCLLSNAFYELSTICHWTERVTKRRRDCDATRLGSEDGREEILTLVRDRDLRVQKCGQQW